VSLAVCLAAAWGSPSDDVSALISRGIALRQHDEPARALDCFRQAMRISPRSLRAHAEYVRTKAYDLDRFDEVRSEYEALMRNDHGNAVCPMALATGQSLTQGREGRVV